MSNHVLPKGALLALEQDLIASVDEIITAIKFYRTGAALAEFYKPSEPIKWRHPLKERPKVNEAIAYVDWHWKKLPCSYSIFTGYYYPNPSDNGASVTENDEHGGGNFGLYWPKDEDDLSDCNFVGAWVPIEEINFPDWVKNKKVN